MLVELFDDEREVCDVIARVVIDEMSGSGIREMTLVDKLEGDEDALVV